MLETNIIVERRQFCDTRLDKLRQKINEIAELKRCPNLCIYLTGSYGRLEASQYSDLDLFLINTGSAGPENHVSNIQKILVLADLIRITQELEFPDLSSDAKYLEIHYLDEIKDELGSPLDDYQNFFTARLLLLLESRPIYNEQLYRQIVEDVIETYYRDYPDHEKDFHPIFLVNDISRFWRTLCLNYEHKRNRPPENPEKKNETHLRNLKLKFSRLLTCFSMMLFLSKNRTVITARELAEFVYVTPLERLQHISVNLDDGDKLLMPIAREYEWFLEMTGKPKEEVLAWISDHTQRDEAFMRARQFRDSMFLFVEQVIPNEILRYLVM